MNFCNCIAVLLILFTPAWAHHGTSVTYQTSKTITLKGTAVEFAYVNPHPQLYFDVKDANGKTQKWGAEFAPTPLMMKNMKAGWTRNSIKAGDEIVIVCNPHRVADATACLLKELTVNGAKMHLANVTAAPAPPAGSGKQ